MTDSQTRFAALPLKQKISAIAFFIIGAFVLYEIIGLFRSGSSSSTTTTPTPKPVTTTMSQATPSTGAPVAPKITPPSNTNSAPMGNNPPPSLPNAANAPASGNSAFLSKPAQELVPPPTSYLVQQNQEQTNYVSAINQLQMLKIEREMAETNQAIVAAKLATVTAEKSITDMLTPELNPASLSMQGKRGNPGGPPPLNMPTNMTVLESPKDSYMVQSVSMQLDQWHAVVSYKGKSYDVSVGDTLPVDGAVVTAIDQKGVTLQIAGEEQRIPFESTDSMSGSSGSSINEVTPAPLAPPAPSK